MIMIADDWKLVSQVGLVSSMMILRARQCATAAKSPWCQVHHHPSKALGNRNLLANDEHRRRPRHHHDSDDDDQSYFFLNDWVFFPPQKPQRGGSEILLHLPSSYQYKWGANSQPIQITNNHAIWIGMPLSSTHASFDDQLVKLVGWGLIYRKQEAGIWFINNLDTIRSVNKPLLDRKSVV